MGAQAILVFSLGDIDDKKGIRLNIVPIPPKAAVRLVKNFLRLVGFFESVI